MAKGHTIPVKLSAPDAVEAAWTTLVAAVTAWSLLAVGLAQLGLFRWWAVLGISLLACAVGWTIWRISSTERGFGWRGAVFLSLLLVVGVILYARPAEHFPQSGDASIYPNTASKLTDTGGLTYRYAPLDGLSAEQKKLFYVPSEEQVPYVEIESYEGLLYGAYYVMDPGQNTIVASRPPLAIAWMALFGMLGGPTGMLYVTPLFGVGSLLAVYFLGKRLFGAQAGALAALWLLVSFPQLYFSRAPYAEVVGQFFVLTALYALIVYLKTASTFYLPLGLLALTAGFSARLDVILLAPVMLLFALLLLLRQDGRGIMVFVGSAVLGLGFTVWTVNRPYVGATGELLLLSQLRFLREFNPYMLVAVAAIALLGVVGLASGLGALSSRWRRGIVRWAVLLAVVVGVGYALHVRPQHPEYVVVGGEAIATHHEELMAVAARYVGYPFFWFAALGVILLFWQRRVGRDHLLFAFFVAFFAGAFFWRYTTARVYPVALRRLLPEVIPGCALLAAFAVKRLSGAGVRWRWLAVAVAGLLAVTMVSVSGRYWFHRGAAGARDTLEEMVGQLPADAAVVFEPRGQGSVVGWFAAPLWSLYSRDALLLNGDRLDEVALEESLCHWHAQGRPIYVLAQKDPSTWWPGRFEAVKTGEISWKSSVIGQSLRFPPYVWRFSFDFSVYRWEGSSSCRAGGSPVTRILAAP